MKNNIIYIHTHDTGRNIEPYGGAVSTPNISRLADQSVVFRNSFSVAPTCSASRAGLLTGEYPHSAGMTGLAHRGFFLKEPEHHLSHYLKNNSYETALFGIQHEAEDPAVLGYNHIHSTYSMNNSEKFDSAAFDLDNTSRLIEYISDYNGNSPYFLSLGLFNTHREFPEAEADINTGSIRPLGNLPNTAAIREETAQFYTSIRVVDRCIGKLLDALEAGNLLVSTMVIFTSDHGAPFPGMKCTLRDDGVGIPLLIHFPGSYENGFFSEALVSHIDIFPTICQLMNLEPPSWLVGNSLMPLIDGSEKAVRERIFGEVTYHAAYEPQRMVRNGEYKYIRYFDDYEYVVSPNIDDGPAKSRLLELGMLDELREKELFYDLRKDPGEYKNLIEDEHYRQIIDDMKKELLYWMEETDDPLLKGYVPAPEMAIVNVKTGLSPCENIFEKTIR